MLDYVLLEIDFAQNMETNKRNCGCLLQYNAYINNKWGFFLITGLSPIEIYCECVRQSVKSHLHILLHLFLLVTKLSKGINYQA